MYKRSVFAALLVLLAPAAAQAHGSLRISTQPTVHVTCKNGTCTATARKAVLNVNDLENLLAAGDVTVDSGPEPNLAIASALSWTSAHTLTLTTKGALYVGALVSDNGSGGLAINDGGDGTLSFFGKGKISFLGLNNPLTINGAPYRLVQNVSSLAILIGAFPKANYALAHDIDAGGTTYASSPVGVIFQGHFEGLGNTISNFSMNITRGSEFNNYQGMFKSLASSAVVENLALTKVQISAANTPHGVILGALVGLNLGQLYGDSVSGLLQDSNDADTAGYIGGLVGENGNTVILCRSSANIVDAEWAGGLIAILNGQYGVQTNVADSSATGTINARGDAGGFVAVTESAQFAPTVTRSFASGDVSGGDKVGGFVAQNSGATISNAYATGSVTAPAFSITGGFAGYNAANISSSYSTGAVSCAGTCGGFIGQDDTDTSHLKNTYWDLDTSGINDPQHGAGTVINDPGITGLTTKQFKSGLPGGLGAGVWAEAGTINNGYPYLLQNPPQ